MAATQTAPPHADGDGFLERLLRLFTPGPFTWVAKSGEPKHRFHAGQHLHGLEEHDVPDRPGDFRGTGLQDIPRRGWSPDPPAR